MKVFHEKFNQQLQQHFKLILFQQKLIQYFNTLQD